MLTIAQILPVAAPAVMHLLRKPYIVSNSY